jgi:transcriptional regulator with XRE-family HTH domain
MRVKNIQDVFSANLRRLRGGRTQAEIAESAGVSPATYQRAENGVIPQKLADVARALGVAETDLFLDPDLIPPPTATPDAVFELIKLLASLDDPQLAAEILSTVKNAIAIAREFQEGHMEGKKSVRK